MIDENTSENDKSSGNNRTAESIDAVTGLVKAIPIYEDLFQPAARELGKGLTVIAKSVNVVLAPLGVMVWGYERIQAQFLPKVLDKLKNTKPEDIIPPKPNIAVPTIEALRYTANDESLSYLFAGLLASSMDKNKASKAHPAFVEIIKQLTTDEAIIISIIKEKKSIPLIDIVVASDENKNGNIVYSNLSSFSFANGLEQPKQFSSYVYNLCRLGLLEIPIEYIYISPSVYKSDDYDEIIYSAPWKEMIDAMNLNENKEFHYAKKRLNITDMGRQFISVCIG
ncbi:MULTISPECIES: DUF4393 domain-containing protein [Pectobacterium]|uniref:DUF4393 domain-containing protein n=1 Tax=Pectobacterium TaxID=122277 RepID=UPI000CD0E5FB|nr:MULTISPECIES: DUF4393 domain-containing protein [Pectobacterium]POE18476.1 hypothetical protein BV923_21390 [Pectobacterium odoriferum]UUE68940.1 DUF4393 domain-containing protein [Pectobacterium aroidearum]UUE73310.1 DUF4393 domain-containing protein [Pectobacterium aroidearum]UUE77650.1 DUF4393 domain-containing protein [Pectobacterium aroidearum]